MQRQPPIHGPFTSSPCMSKTWLDSWFTVSHQRGAGGSQPYDATPRDQMTEKPAGEAVGSSPWWTPERHADIRPFLAARGAITRAVRAWFDEQGFVEVETGILQVSPGNETHLHAPRTELASPDGGRVVRYLRTSPEFAAKKLLAGGEQKIFEFARVFRDRERGDLHLPEFTMLEWYRANASYDAIMADSVVVIAHAAQDIRTA